MNGTEFDHIYFRSVTKSTCSLFGSRCGGNDGCIAHRPKSERQVALSDAVDKIDRGNARPRCETDSRIGCLLSSIGGGMRTDSLPGSARQGYWSRTNKK